MADTPQPTIKVTPVPPKDNSSTPKNPDGSTNIDYNSDFAFRGSTGTSTGSQGTGTQGSSSGGSLGVSGARAGVQSIPEIKVVPVASASGDASKGVVQADAATIQNIYAHPQVNQTDASLQRLASSVGLQYYPAQTNNPRDYAVVPKGTIVNQENFGRIAPENTEIENGKRLASSLGMVYYPNQKTNYDGYKDVSRQPQQQKQTDNIFTKVSKINYDIFNTNNNFIKNAQSNFDEAAGLRQKELIEAGQFIANEQARGVSVPKSAIVKLALAQTASNIIVGGSYPIYHPVKFTEAAGGFFLGLALNPKKTITTAVGQFKEQPISMVGQLTGQGLFLKSVSPILGVGLNAIEKRLPPDENFQTGYVYAGETPSAEEFIKQSTLNQLRLPPDENFQTGYVYAGETPSAEFIKQSPLNQFPFGAAYSGTGERLSPKSKVQLSKESRRMYYNPNIRNELVKVNNQEFYAQQTRGIKTPIQETNRLTFSTNGDLTTISPSTIKVESQRFGDIGTVQKSLTKGTGMKPLYEVEFIQKGQAETLGGKAYSRPASQVKTANELPQEYLIIMERKGIYPNSIGVGKSELQSGQKFINYPEDKTIDLINTKKQSEVPTYPYRGTQTSQPKGFRSGTFQSLKSRFEAAKTARAAEIKNQLPVVIQSGDMINTNQVWDVANIKSQINQLDTYGLSRPRTLANPSTTGDIGFTQGRFKDLANSMKRKVKSKYGSYYNEDYIGTKNNNQLGFDNVITLRTGQYKILELPQLIENFGLRGKEVFLPLFATNINQLNNLNNNQNNVQGQNQLLIQQQIQSQSPIQGFDLSQTPTQIQQPLQEQQQQQEQTTMIIPKEIQMSIGVPSPKDIPKDIINPKEIRQPTNPERPFIKNPEPNREFPKLPENPKPPKKPILNGKEKKLKEKSILALKKKGYNILIKNKLTKKGKRKYKDAGFTQVNSQALTLESAKGLGMQLASSNARRSFKIVQANNEGQSNPQLEAAYLSLNSRFAQSKRQPNTIVQKTQFSISSAGEKAEIRRRKKNVYF